MIVVKTKMRQLPVNCSKCGFFTPASQNYNGYATCRAKTGYYQGKIIAETNFPYAKDNGRTSWCPLKEVTE